MRKVRAIAAVLCPLLAAATPASAHASTTTISVAGGGYGTISPMLLGGNGRWAYDDFGGWNPATQQAYPEYVKRSCPEMSLATNR